MIMPDNKKKLAELQAKMCRICADFGCFCQMHSKYPLLLMITWYVWNTVSMTFLHLEICKLGANTCVIMNKNYIWDLTKYSYAGINRKGSTVSL